MKNNFWGKLITLLMVNFGALALGAAWTDPGTNSDWYRLANQAPWSPPGWVFGAAWFTIGVTYSLMITFIETSTYRNLDQIYRWFWVSVILNVVWNPVFFMFHAVWTGVGVLIALAACVYYLVDFARQALGWKVAWLGVPYFLWLMVAISLNWYFAIMN